MNLHSGYPYSMIKHGLPFNYPRLEKSISTDVIIMGGGISGALTAYHLVNKGVDCVVIDRRTIGLGSTCSSTSLLQFQFSSTDYFGAATYCQAVENYWAHIFLQRRAHIRDSWPHIFCALGMAGI